MTIEKLKKKNDPLKNLESLAYNKMMPHSIELEKAVLGTLTLYPDRIYTIIDILKPDDFYLEIHQVIYQASLNLFDKSHAPDLLLIAEELKRMGELENIGGPYYLSICQNEVISDANIEAHCRIVKQKSLKRSVINVCAETIKRMFQDESDVFDVLEDHEERMFVNTAGIIVRHDITMSKIGIKFLKEVEEAWIHGMGGVPIGIPKLDNATKGLQPGDVSIIGARTRHGKSALATAVLLHCSMQINPEFPHNSPYECKYPGAFMSIEMKDTQVYARLVSAELAEMGFDIPYSHFKGGKEFLTEEHLKLINIAVERLSKRGMYIDDTPDLNPLTLKARAMQMVRKYGIKFLIIDYAQLMNNPTANKNDNRAESLATIAKFCKALAKMLNIHIILLSQIDRDTEKREPRPPVIADLGGSDALTYAVDNIFLCWRPEVWNDNAVDEETGMSDKGIMYISLAKHKQGKVHNKERVPFSMATNSYGDMSIIEGYDTVNSYLNKQNNVA